MSDTFDNIEHIIEAAIFAAGEPVTVEKIVQLFPVNERPTKDDVNAALAKIELHYHERGVELVKVGSGYRFQAKAEFAPWMQRLWEKKPPRYTRALLETLALIAYRQPITRGEVEEVRGVAVSTNITKTLLERGWVKVVGHKDVPGKPALFATTKTFLDYFNLKKLSDLPPLSELVDLEELGKQLGMNLEAPEKETAEGEVAAAETVEAMEAAEPEDTVAEHVEAMETVEPEDTVAEHVEAMETVEPEDTVAEHAEVMEAVEPEDTVAEHAEVMEAAEPEDTVAENVEVMEAAEPEDHVEMIEAEESVDNVEAFEEEAEFVAA